MNAKQRTVLLVEDNAGDVELILRVLRKHGMANHVHVVGDGAEALDYLFERGAHAARRESEAPVVILLDLKLPKVDGFEVLKQVRASERTNWIPVVVLTSSEHEDDLVRSYRLGANSYVRKPVDFAEFSKTVHQLGLYWLLLNEIPGA